MKFCTLDLRNEECHCLHDHPPFIVLAGVPGVDLHSDFNDVLHKSWWNFARLTFKTRGKSLSTWPFPLLAGVPGVALHSDLDEILHAWPNTFLEWHWNACRVELVIIKILFWNKIFYSHSNMPKQWFGWCFDQVDKLPLGKEVYVMFCFPHGQY